MILRKLAKQEGFEAEEHIVFVNGPEGRYLDHIVVEPGKGTGRDVGQAVSTGLENMTLLIQFWLCVQMEQR